MAIIKFIVVFILLLQTLPNDSSEQCISRKPLIHLERTDISQDITKKHNDIITEWLPHSTAHGKIVGEFFYTNGVLTIPESGLYRIYCQVYFRASPPTMPLSFSVQTNSQGILLGQVGGGNEATAHSSGIFKLNKGDSLLVKLFSSWGTTTSMKVYMGRGHTFLGVYML